MSGVVYVTCTPVGRAIIKSHLTYHKNIPVAGIVNLSHEMSLKKANYDNLNDCGSTNNLELFYCKDLKL